jgi:archaetidylinositol phosphate synthase
MRIQDNILARPERRLMAGDLLGRLAVGFLALALAGYVLHWLGDSMDGSLARHRGTERPRYGRYVDHASDALSNFMIMAGLGLSGHVRMGVAMFTLAAYLALTLHVVLRAQALDEFRISFLLLGPTELRLALVAITLAMMAFGPGWVDGGALRITAYEIPILVAGAAFLAIFAWQLRSTADQLRRLGESPVLNPERP